MLKCVQCVLKNRRATESTDNHHHHHRRRRRRLLLQRQQIRVYTQSHIMYTMQQRLSTINKLNDNKIITMNALYA